ncbi:asparaginase [Sediminivirga luteola]|uniref:Asparaginase n=1 Tax=Sediminivirga luteola TaxID=1774748 RepID=A0A8J2XFW8_9MICO|nr:asparaginase [Sediminivirga luteola]GGA13328.1 asparaginase [Sediminivirga luteola]
MSQALPATFTAAQAAELAVVTRSGFIESRHLGAGVALSPAQPDAPALTLGDPAAATATPVFARSCLKPVQALAVLRAGVPLRGEEAALAMASHIAQDEHIAVVRRMLASSGLAAEQLQCPAVLPQHGPARARALAAGEKPSPLYFNCSGKHTAFLMACRANGWDEDTYLDPGHPLQQLIAETVAELAGLPGGVSADHIGVDGCGAPVFALPLAGLARAVSAVVAGTDEHTAELTRAALEHPWGIEGHGRPNSVAIERLGILAKFGAEGVMVMARPGGPAVALKCLDGSSRATTLAGLVMLHAAGGAEPQAVAEVWERVAPAITGGNAVVGAVLPGAGLRSLLAPELAGLLGADPDPAGSAGGKTGEQPGAGRR